VRVDVGNLAFAYSDGDFSLHVDDLVINSGAAVAVIGPSGSGKTTLLHLVAGIALARTGRILIDGTDVTALAAAARRDFRIRRIGLVFQEFELLEYLSVLDNILLPYRISTAMTLDRSVRERAADLATQVGLGDKLRRNVRRLSHGERQRVSVCRALLPQPGLLLADEPTGNLDPSNKWRVLEILLDYTRGAGATMVTVTHDHDLLDHFDSVIDLRPSARGMTAVYRDVPTAADMKGDGQP